MNLLKALVTVSSMTLLSRISGLVRDMLQGAVFGAGGPMDAYIVAFRLPNLLRRLFGEGAFSQAFVPILGEYRNRRGENETHRLIDDVATLLFWALAAVTAMGTLAAPAIIWLVTDWADKPQQFDLATLLLRIMFPYILFLSLVAFATGILNTWRRFAVPAFSPVLLNLSLIAGTLIAARYAHPPVHALAIAVFVGGVLQLAIQLPALHRIGMLPRLRLDLRAAWADEGVRRILRLMGPALLGVSVAQISIVINTKFATWLPEGSVSWLYFADRLMEFPTALLGVALGTVLLPSLSKAHAGKDGVEYSALLDWGLRLVFLLATPAAVALGVLASPLMATLFHNGRFTAIDVAMSAQALVAYAVGLIGLIAVKILAPGFYARQDIRTPVKIALLVLVLTQLMNLAFIGPLKHAGLALSISVAACINAGLLYIGLRRRGIYVPQPGWGLFLLRLTVVLAALGVGLYFAVGRFDWIALRAQPTLRIGALAGIVVAGAGLYFALLLVLGFKLKDFRRRA